MAASQQGSGDIISAINVTPLVDVMLVLLIIFMVTAHLVGTPPRAVDVQLPTASEAGQTNTSCNIVLTAEGVTLVDDLAAPDDASLLQTLQRKQRDSRVAEALINADKRVSHGRVMEVMEVLSQAHIDRIAFAVTLTPPTSAAP